MEWTTTVRDIHRHEPCEGGFARLLRWAVGYDGPDDDSDTMYNSLTEEQKSTTVTIHGLIEHNTPSDVYWTLRVWPYREYCLLLADIAEDVLPLFEKDRPDDDRPRKCIDAIRRWHSGDASDEDLSEASRAARDAASRVSADAASRAVYGAWSAASCAAADSRWSAAANAAVYAAWNAVLNASNAARDAAGDAARDAARDAAWNKYLGMLKEFVK